METVKGNSLSALLQIVPQVRGKLRLTRILSKLLGTKDHNVVIRSRKYELFFKLPDIKKEQIGLELFANGVYEPEEITLFTWILEQMPGEFVDVGANIGSLCLPIAKKFPNRKVIAVEAAPNVYGFLMENIRMNSISNIEALNLCMHSDDDKLVNFFSDNVNFGKGSLSPVFSEKSSSVKTARLDSLLQNRRANPALVKMDVEGYEKTVLEGSEGLLKSVNAPIFIFEFAAWAEKLAGFGTGTAQQKFLDNGFEIFMIQPGGFTKIAKIETEGACMILAIKPSHAMYSKVVGNKF